MNRIFQPLTFFVAALLFFPAAPVLAVVPPSTRFFDVNDDDAESGVTNGVIYQWDTTQPYWSANSDGSGIGPGTTATWVNGDNATFSAGNDGAGLRYGLDIAAAITAGSATIKEGTVVIVNGTLDTGSGTVTINAGATLEIGNPLRLNNTAGKVLLNGGTFFNSNPNQAANFVGTAAGLKGLEVNGSGAIAYDDGDLTPDNKTSIFWGVISGTGGTTANGGAGTLTKIGTDIIGVSGVDQGGGVNSQSMFTFAKLVVKQGGYRGRLVTISGQPQLDERVFGAVPLNVLPDAITLDGGGVGVMMPTTLNPNRGITIGPDGGYFDHGAGASLNIPGPLSGAGTLTIGDPTSTFVANPTFTLSNANNANTFTGGLVGVRGLLQLNSSLKVAGLNDGVTNNATIGIAASQILTVGTGNGNDSWSTIISGAGGFAKVGTGQQTLTGSPTYSGDTRVQGGTLSITSAYLANGADIYLSTGSIFNLNFSGTDTIRSLYFDNILQATGTWGAPGSGAQFTSSLLSGAGRLGATIGVPEPTSVGLALFGILMCLACRRRLSLAR